MSTESKSVEDLLGVIDLNTKQTSPEKKDDVRTDIDENPTKQTTFTNDHQIILRALKKKTPPGRPTMPPGAPIPGIPAGL